MHATAQQLAPVLCPDLSQFEQIEHGFFTITGGVSKGLYKSLNAGLGSADLRQNVITNRELIASHFACKPTELLTPYQFHSADVEFVTAPFGDNRPKCDGLVTNSHKIALGILTADCGPVLFCDPKAGIVGASHAGWQGATSGILENTIDTMLELGANKSYIKAVLGPTISQKNYEVGPEFVTRLLKMDKDNQSWLIPSPKPDHAMFDLPGYIVNRLARYDVSASWTGHCTYQDHESFYSYRRSTHKNQSDYGRQMSAIKLLD